MSILRIDASGRHDGSVSRKLTDRIIAKLGGDVVERDLIEQQPDFVDAATIGAYFTPPADRSDAQKAQLTQSDAVVAELMAADTIVIGLPIYNFTIPAVMKAWADQVARVGVTFKYTETGPVGLLENKRAIIAVASGGTEVGGDMDFATPWMRFFLGFLGIKDVTVISADQLNMGADTKVEAAYGQIDDLQSAA